MFFTPQFPFLFLEVLPDHNTTQTNWHTMENNLELIPYSTSEKKQLKTTTEPM